MDDGCRSGLPNFGPGTQRTARSHGRIVARPRARETRKTTCLHSDHTMDRRPPLSADYIRTRTLEVTAPEWRPLALVSADWIAAVLFAAWLRFSAAQLRLPRQVPRLAESKRVASALAVEGGSTSSRTRARWTSPSCATTAAHPDVTAHRHEWSPPELEMPS